MTRAIITLVVMVVAAAVMITPAASEYEPADENSRVFEGRVVDVNVGGVSSYGERGGADRFSYFFARRGWGQDIYDIKLSDIETGDYVSVEYYRSGAESRVPLKVTRITLKYDDSKAGK